MSHDLEVAEGIHGTFYYHLWKRPERGSGGTALCGDRVMVTGIPRSAWGTTTDLGQIKERWCSRCKAIADRMADYGT